MRTNSRPEGIARIACLFFAAGWHETAPPHPTPTEGRWTAWTSPNRMVLAIAAARDTDEHEDPGDRLDVDIRGCYRRRSTWTAPDWLICLDGWPQDAAVAAAMSAATPDSSDNRSLTLALLENRWVHRDFNDPIDGAPVRTWTGHYGSGEIRLGSNGWHLTRHGLGRTAEGHGTRSVPPVVIKNLIFSP